MDTLFSNVLCQQAVFKQEALVLGICDRVMGGTSFHDVPRQVCKLESMMWPTC